MYYSRVCSAGECRSDRYREIAVALKEDPDRLHRKIWEFYAIIVILHNLNILTPGSNGLGFAVGQEPLSAYLASTGCIITASDLVDQDSIWNESNQVALDKSHLNLRNICSGPVFKENVTFMNIDMNNIPDSVKQGKYDFIWSSCAMEHLGSIENGINFVKNSLTCLKDRKSVV